MKLACEIPVPCLSLVNPHTDFDFIIASHCVNNKAYKQYFIDSRKENKHRFSILDNGAFEEGKAINSDVYKELVNQLVPNVIVLPDVVNDAKETLKMSMKFMDDYFGMCSSGLYDLMGVLQGKSTEEYMMCLEEYARYDAIGIIGIPYHLFYRPLFIEKNNIIEFCRKRCLEIHILGLPNPFEVVELSKYSDVVVSIDTSLPIVSAKNNLKFENFAWKRERININEKYTVAQQATAIENIVYLKDLIGSKKEFISHV